MKPIKIANHRNGISGIPFHVGIIQDQDYSKKLIIQFDAEERGFTAVLDMDLLKQDVIEFGKNSWRGDRYEDLFKGMVCTYETMRWKKK